MKFTKRKIKNKNLKDKLFYSWQVIKRDYKNTDWRDITLILIILLFCVVMWFMSDKLFESDYKWTEVTYNNTEFDPCDLNNVECDDDIIPVIEQKTPQIAEISSYVAVITAYSEYDSCHYPGCPMASGTKAYIGAIACPRAYALGTKVEIEGMGVYTCEDRTATFVDGRFDIFTGYGQEAYNEAINFGKRSLKVKII